MVPVHHCWILKLFHCWQYMMIIHIVCIICFLCFKSSKASWFSSSSSQSKSRSRFNDDNLSENSIDQLSHRGSFSMLSWNSKLKTIQQKISENLDSFLDRTIDDRSLRNSDVERPELELEFSTTFPLEVLDAVPNDSKKELLQQQLFQILYRSISLREVINDRDCKMIMDANAFVIFLKRNLFGSCSIYTYVQQLPLRKSIPLKSPRSIEIDSLCELKTKKAKKKGKEESSHRPGLDKGEEIVIADFITPTASRSLKSTRNCLRIVIKTFIEAGKIHVRLSGFNAGLSSKDLKSTITIVKEFLQSRVQRETQMVLARFKQQQNLTVESKAAEEKRLSKELDMVINPEKYRTKSNTVRRAIASGDSGGGRFTPSASTQARRQVKRGG